MEPRFEVTLIPDRKICHEFGAITARKNAATWVLLGCSLVVLLVLYPLCMVFDGGSACQSLWAVGLMSFYIWLLLGWGNGRNVYRTLCTQLQGMPVTYAFGPNEVYVTSKPENSCVRYDSFVQILETPRLFALYISQNTAHLIPKQALQTGTPEEFRAYLEEVTGKPVRQVRGKRSTGANWYGDCSHCHFCRRHFGPEREAEPSHHLHPGSLFHFPAGWVPEDNTGRRCPCGGG